MSTARLQQEHWHNGQVQLTEHLYIMQCLLVTSKTPDSCTIGQLYPIPLMYWISDTLPQGRTDLQL